MPKALTVNVLFEGSIAVHAGLLLDNPLVAYHKAKLYCLNSSSSRSTTSILSPSESSMSWGGHMS